MKLTFENNEIVIKHKTKNNNKKMNDIITSSFNNCFITDDNIHKDEFKCRIFISKNGNKNKNRVRMEYKLKNSKIKMFGSKYVRNNRKNIYIIYQGKKYNIVEYFTDINYKKIKFKIQIIILSYVNNLEEMFSECDSLISIKDFSNINTKTVRNMRGLFSRCSSLVSISDISNWNISKVTDINSLFYNCSSLQSLPDISKWNINNVTMIFNLFYNCSSLKSLPDISKWNTNNVTTMFSLFSN